MTRWALVCVATLACSSSNVEPLQPFQTPSWTTVPSDDELVRAIVGPGGSVADRADVERIARDLLLAPLRARDSLDGLRQELDLLRRHFHDELRDEPHEAFLRVALGEAASHLRGQAARLAAARLQQDLWPREAFPEEWQSSAETDPATVARAAAAMSARLDEITVRYIARVPLMLGDPYPPVGSIELGTNRAFTIAPNHAHVALTGDYSKTADGIHDVLVARGMATYPIPVGELH